MRGDAIARLLSGLVVLLACGAIANAEESDASHDVVRVALRQALAAAHADLQALKGSFPQLGKIARPSPRFIVHKTGEFVGIVEYESGEKIPAAGKGGRTFAPGGGAVYFKLGYPVPCRAPCRTSADMEAMGATVPQFLERYYRLPDGTAFSVQTHVVGADDADGRAFASRMHTVLEDRVQSLAAQLEAEPLPLQ